MRIILLPLNSDNYGYLLLDETAQECAVVDVSGQPEKVLDAIKEYATGYSFTTIFTTHKHWDHAGGNDQIKREVPNLTIYGGEREGVEGCTHPVKDGDVLTFGSGAKFTCLLTPGHTMGHICYFMEHEGQRAVFSGDCLFVGGAGKFFEGTGADMYTSLYEKLMQLPLDTLVYCGHEYTLSNYRFAVALEPSNERLAAENAAAIELRAAGKPTIPSSIEKEMATNPFMRVKELASSFPEVASDPREVLTAIREAKNNFK